MRKRNIVLTGLPRSGTSLTCSLLDKAPNTVALNAPITPGRFAELLPDLDAVADGIEQYFRRARRRIHKEGVAISKHAGGQIADNAYGRPDAEGRRKSVLEKGKISVHKELDDRFFLVIKQPGLFTAMLPQLAARLPCYALVRNPWLFWPPASASDVRWMHRSEEPNICRCYATTRRCAAGWLR